MRILRRFAAHREGALYHVGITDVITLMDFYTNASMTLAFYDVPAGATGMEH